MPVKIADVEVHLNKLYKGLYCSFTYPGYEPVHGIVNSMAIDEAKLPEVIVIIFIKESRYTVSAEALTDTLKIIGRGNTRGSEAGDGGRK